MADFPAYGQARTSNEPNKQEVYVSRSGVRSIWLQHDLANFKLRLKALETKVAIDDAILTEALVHRRLKRRNTTMKDAARSKRPIRAIWVRRTRSTKKTSSGAAQPNQQGTEFCGRPDKYGYQLFLAIYDNDHMKTKVKSPQTNGICERFHRTIQQGHYQISFRKNPFETIQQFQADLNEWLHHNNTERTHKGKMCC